MIVVVSATGNALSASSIASCRGVGDWPRAADGSVRACASIDAVSFTTSSRTDMRPPSMSHQRQHAIDERAQAPRRDLVWHGAEVDLPEYLVDPESIPQLRDCCR